MWCCRQYEIALYHFLILSASAYFIVVHSERFLLLNFQKAQFMFHYLQESKMYKPTSFGRLEITLVFLSL